MILGRRELVQLPWLRSTQLSRVTAFRGCCGTESNCNCEKEQQTPCCSSAFIHRASSWFPLGLLGEARRLSQSGRVGGCRWWQCQAPGGRGWSCDAPAPHRAQPPCQHHGCLHTECIAAGLSLGSGFIQGEYEASGKALLTCTRFIKLIKKPTTDLGLVPIIAVGACWMLIKLSVCCVQRSQCKPACVFQALEELSSYDLFRTK